MNGGFRKRRGGDGFEMSDEEDEIEQRRRKKQMQFKQQTKALMADERLAQIGHNPKKAAFFQTLADHMEDPDYEFLDAPGMDANQEPSQSQSDENNNESQNNEITVPDSQTIDIPAPVPINPLKRKAPDSQDSQKENRPPPHKRRTAATDNMIARKPMTLADVQHSVSELLEDHRIIVPNSQLSDSDSELEIEPPTKFTSRNPIIDRLTLSRQNSALSETTDSANGGMAFHAAANGVHQPGFRIPSLVRRATSNFSTVSTGSSGASTPSETSVRRGGTGRSNIHAQAREAERRAAVEKVELKRKETLKKKVAAKRGKRSVLGSLDQGFE
jgi:mediator of replication checkpoint protein 1